MIIQELYNQVLISPSQVANTLYIVSGYASPEFAYTHLTSLPPNVVVNLIIGMASREGITQRAHTGFINLANSFPGRFNCYYYTSTGVHSKAYAWFDNSVPISGFIGSANYSQNAFLGAQGECMTSVDATQIHSYFHSLLAHCVLCTASDVESLIPITTSSFHRPISLAFTPMFNPSTSPEIDTVADLNFEQVELTLLMQNQHAVPTTSGINWGQRDNREPNQAYIAIPSSIYRTNFFPPIAHPFTVLTDDGMQFTFVRAQENGKALHTTENNSILGRYLRQRMGVALGSYVTLEDLERYGRTSVTISKINDSLFFLDFSV